MLTEISCSICCGTKIHPRLPSVPCGACFGTGRSTNPCDQPEHWTMVGTGNFGLDFIAWWHNFMEQHPGVKRDGAGVKLHDRYIAIPVGFPNTEYEARLVLDRAGILHPAMS